MLYSYSHRDTYLCACWLHSHLMHGSASPTVPALQGLLLYIGRHWSHNAPIVSEGLIRELEVKCAQASITIETIFLLRAINVNRTYCARTGKYEVLAAC